MGQWDPELRASAEARQAGKQAESKTKQRLAKARNKRGDAQDAVDGIWGERGRRAEEVGGNQGLRRDKGEPRILRVSRCSSALKMELTLFAPPGPRLHWQIVGALDTRRRARHVGSCRRQFSPVVC